MYHLLAKLIYWEVQPTGPPLRVDSVITNQPRERASSVLALGASFCLFDSQADLPVLIEFYKEFNNFN